MRALLVDDDHELARLLTDYMRPHGVSVDHVVEGTGALARIAATATPYDIVLLDVMLPGIDGFEVCRRIRSKHDVPIVMLTARGEDTDRVVGLEIGADDYVPKPFNPRELLARMRAVLRRAHPAPPPPEGRRPDVTRPEGRRPDIPRPVEAAEPAGPLQVGDLVVDVPAHKATLAGRELQLTSFELRVLAVLARRAGEPVTREELASAVLPKGGTYDPSVDRSLDVHVSHLRQKMGDGPREPRRIRTVRGIGYVLVKPS
jgi:two-component system response regulator CpxR